MEYTAVIRTLGKAGEKYQTLLDSLVSQTIPPKAIIVYIAEGYPVPAETVGIERYVYVKKGMVAQRALRYDEVETEYMLFLDDDVYLAPNSVSVLYSQLIEKNADVISPDVFDNASRPKIAGLMMTLSGRMRPRKDDGVWGYKVMRTTGYSYNSNPVKPTYFSQTNAGPCFFCKKLNFLKARFEEELWMDDCQYALGDDQTMFYKMYCVGLKILTSYNSGIKHLDAGGNLTKEKEKILIYSDFRFKTIFWHRFIFRPEKHFFLKVWDCICIGYAFAFSILVSFFKCRFDVLKLKYSAICDGIRFIHSKEYNKIPLVKYE